MEISNDLIYCLIALVVIFYVTRGSGDGFKVSKSLTVPTRISDADVARGKRNYQKAAAMREGFATAREGAELAKAAVGGKKSAGSQDLLAGIYGEAAADLDGGACIDSNDTANTASSDYSDYIAHGQLAYGPDVVRNQEEWVKEVAPWSQTAAIGPDDLSIDEMRATPLMGIAAWTRPAPAVSSNAWQVPEQSQGMIDAAAIKSTGTFNSAGLDTSASGV